MLNSLLTALGLRKPQVFGIDYIGGAKYPAKIVRNHPVGWAAGFLWSVDGFGKADKAISKLAKSGKAPIIRVHLIWHDNHKFGKGDIPKALGSARALNAIIKEYPYIQWMVSPFLEATIKNEHMLAAVNRLREELDDDVVIVSNGLKALSVPGAWTEMHHSSYKNVKGKKIFSFDGIEAVDSNVTKWKKRAKSADIIFFWRYTFNGKFGPKDSRKRSKRTSFPSDRDILSVIPLAKKRGKIKLPSGWTFKTHAERHEGFSPRANKPVLLTTRKFSKVELRVKKKVIAKASYSGNAHGSHIYRFNKWGFELLELARKISGKSITLIYADGKRVGKVNPAFRSGRFLG